MTGDIKAAHEEYQSDSLGDASLMISDLSLSDSGEYSCKVKNGGKYHWNTVNLIVLGESAGPSHSASNEVLFQARWTEKDVTDACVTQSWGQK